MILTKGKRKIIYLRVNKNVNGGNRNWFYPEMEPSDNLMRKSLLYSNLQRIWFILKTNANFNFYFRLKSDSATSWYQMITTNLV